MSIQWIQDEAVFLKGLNEAEKLFSRPKPAAAAFACKIHSLSKSYGFLQPFLRFYRFREAGAAGIFYLMDGEAVFLGDPKGSDELAEFFRMNQDIRTLLAPKPDKQYNDYAFERFSGQDTGGILVYQDHPFPLSIEETEKQVDLKSLYQLYQACGMLTGVPFDLWYCDTSHRIRHGQQELFAISRDGMPVSCAAIGARDNKSAVLTGVATAPAYRRQGLGKAVVSHAVNSSIMRGDQPMVFAKSREAAAFYQSLGFSMCGQWVQYTL